jgi:hypothetical protein
MTGIAKAWVQFNGTSGASPVIRGSFNLSSVTRNGTGDYTLNFTTAMADINYSSVGTSQFSLSGDRNTVVSAPYNQAPTTSALRICTTSGTTAGLTDMLYVSVAIVGN